MLSLIDCTCDVMLIEKNNFDFFHKTKVAYSESEWGHF